METTNPPSSQIPWRLREDQFRRYETILKNAVERFPLVFTVNLRNYNLPTSLVTCAARLRDAKISYSRFNWPSTIDRVKYLACCDELVVAEGNGFLMLGRLDEVRAYAKSQSPQPKIIETAQGIKDDYELKVTRDQFFFLCQLATHDVFKKDLILSSSDETFNLSNHALPTADSYAISLVPDGERWRLLSS